MQTLAQLKIKKLKYKRIERMKGIIFDLDGVLVDTAKYHFLAWKRLAEELGIEFNEEDNEQFKGVSRVRCMEILTEMGNLTLSDEEKTDYAARKNNWYRELIEKMDKSEILPGALEFLKEAKGAGIKTSLGSASKNAGVILEKTGLAGYLDSVVDGNHVSRAKPDPEVFLKGAESLNLKPEECVVFEDARAGVEAALNAGMKAVGIGDSEILKRADRVFPSMDGLKLSDLGGL